MGLNSLQTLIGLGALSDALNDERAEVERLEYEKRSLEDEIKKMKPSSNRGPWSKEDQKNFELNWHSLGSFDLEGNKVDKPKTNSDFSNFIW